ncbi:hypothetical protein OPQ81_010650 [Rhizoctonia solani]|nr:hypothetical protein OPQ81_010650 [Rhizoctonia solani]
MAKLTRTASDTRAPRPTHPTRPDDQDSQKTPESPSNSNNLANVDQTPRVPRRSQSLLHGLASASQTDVSRGPSLVEQKARQQLIFVTDATEPCRQSNEYGLDEQPREQTPHTHQHSYDPNAHNNVAVPPANAEHRSSTCVASKIAVKPVLESSRGESDHGHLPDVKALLYGNSRECYSAADIRRFKAACLKYVNGIHPNNIRVHFGDEPIGKEFSWFFDPNDIAPGGTTDSVCHWAWHAFAAWCRHQIGSIWPNTDGHIRPSLSDQ